MKTKSKKSLTKLKKEVIYGANPIIEMLKTKRRKLLALYTRKPLPKSWYRIKQYLPKSIPNIQYVAKNVLDGIAQSTEHMGIVALVTPFKYTTTMFITQKKSVILLCDGIQDVGNLGAILRSAYCSGIDGVVLSKRHGTLLTPAVFKASAGYAEYLDIYVTSSVTQAATEIQQAGYHLYLSVINGKNVTTVEFKKPACLVIGNEATGISKNILNKGTKITIPQRSQDISYNASVAAGILLFFITWKSNIF